MPERILVTGITGFVGSHLADYVLAQGAGYEIHGTKRWHLSRMDHVAHIADRIQWRDCNLLDPVAVRDLVWEVKPDRIFHCAAESFVSPSWAHPSHYMDVNYKCTLNLLEALRYFGSKATIHIPGSGEEYGEVHPDELPIREDSILRPVNPYAVSKIAQDLIGYVYFRSYGVRVIRTRTFNHEGPRRETVFGIPWYAFQIARAENGKQEPRLEVGHLDDRRNFTHVRDIVEAYWVASEKCEPGELYLIGSEEADHIHTFREALERLIEMSTVKGIRYETVPKYVRPTQVPNLVADVTKFRARTGWKSKLSYEQILADTLEYWRERVRSGKA
jgi:GDP-4-dehydro-6-deoxy-D-mannose reductase